MLRADYLFQSGIDCFRNLRSTGTLQPYFRCRLLPVRNVWLYDISPVGEHGIKGRQVDRIHQHLCLTVSAVRQLDFRLDPFRVGILGLGDGDLEGQVLIEAQAVEPGHKVVIPDLQRGLRKVNIIGVNIGIFQVDRAVVVKRRHLILSPAGILLPAKSRAVCAKAFARRQRSRGKPDDSRYRLKRGAGRKTLAETVKHRLSLIFI